MSLFFSGISKLSVRYSSSHTQSQSLYFTTFKGLKYQDLRLRNQPNITDSSLDECVLSKHLVESPSGELFFIKWYTKCLYVDDGRVDTYKVYYIEFMVFREDKKSKDFCYTEDTGDLCIFLSKSEAFCLSASMYPGLKPNSIYYIGRRAGSYDLACGNFFDYDDYSLADSYWIHPTDPIHEKGTEKGIDGGISLVAGGSPNTTRSCSDLDES